MHYIDLNNERRKTHDEHSFALIDGGDRPCFSNYHYCCSTSIFSHILVLCTDWTMDISRCIWRKRRNIPAYWNAYQEGCPQAYSGSDD